MRKITILLILLCLPIIAQAVSINSIPIETNVSQFEYRATQAISPEKIEVRYTNGNDIYKVMITKYDSYDDLMTILLTHARTSYVIEEYDGKKVLVQKTKRGDIIEWSDKNYIIDVDRGDMVFMKNLIDAYMRIIDNDIPDILRARCSADAECDDSNDHTEDKCEDGYCVNLQIIECKEGDNYCPGYCNYINDPDCDECKTAQDCRTDEFSEAKCEGTPKRCIASPKCGTDDGICPEGCLYYLDKDCEFKPEARQEETQARANPTIQNETEPTIQEIVEQEQKLPAQKTIMQRILAWIKSIFRR